MEYLWLTQSIGKNGADPSILCLEDLINEMLVRYQSKERSMCPSMELGWVSGFSNQELIGLERLFQSANSLCSMTSAENRSLSGRDRLVIDKIACFFYDMMIDHSRIVFGADPFYLDRCGLEPYYVNDVMPLRIGKSVANLLLKLPELQDLGIVDLALASDVYDTACVTPMVHEMPGQFKVVNQAILRYEFISSDCLTLRVNGIERTYTIHSMRESSVARLSNLELMSALAMGLVAKNNNQSRFKFIPSSVFYDSKDIIE